MFCISTSASKSSNRRFVITEKAPTRAFSWSLNVKLGPRRKGNKGRAVVAAFNQEKALVGAFSVITNLRMELFEALCMMEAVLGGARSAEH